MATEKANYVSDLDPNRPQGGTAPSYDDGEGFWEGDNHIRLIKKTLVDTFPVHNVPLTVEDDYLNGISDNLDAESTGELKLIGTNYDTLLGEEEERALKLDENLNVIQAIRHDCAIGTVFWSVLTLQQMDDTYGAGNYVELDGNPIDSSKRYNTLWDSIQIGSLHDAGYMRPTYLNAQDTGWQIQESSTSEIGLATGMDASEHTHDIPHTHSYSKMGNDNRYNDENDKGGATNGARRYLNIRKIKTDHASISISDATHTHTMNISNDDESRTSNKLKRLKLYCYMRVN
jgi:hypothetical protein